MSELTLIFQQLTTGELEALQRTLTSAEQCSQRLHAVYPHQNLVKQTLSKTPVETDFLVTPAGVLVLLLYKNPGELSCSLSKRVGARNVGT